MNQAAISIYKEMADNASNSAGEFDTLSDFEHISLISPSNNTGTGIHNSIGSGAVSHSEAVRIAAGKVLGLTPHTIATSVYHLLALIIGLIFGAWAIKSYNATLIANDLQRQSLVAANNASQAANALANQSIQIALASNEQALLSSQIAFLQICYAGSDILKGSDSNACEAVLATFPFVSLAQALSFSVLVPTSTTSLHIETTGTE
ncbi:MAG: hypothetical protein Q9187_008933, partial [Circinaria calcarea]